MRKTVEILSAVISSTEITRFNALRQGILSRYTVLPWEDAAEYQAIVEALAAEHQPQGLTEEHLVEELAGILWRKRRLRLAEAAAHRRGLMSALSPFRDTVKASLVHLDATDQAEHVVDAIQATAEETLDDIADLEADEAMTGVPWTCSGPAGTTLTRRRSVHCERILKAGGRTCSAGHRRSQRRVKLH
jgi:hypothetical protein